MELHYSETEEDDRYVEVFSLLEYSGLMAVSNGIDSLINYGAGPSSMKEPFYWPMELFLVLNKRQWYADIKSHLGDEGILGGDHAG